MTRYDQAHRPGPRWDVIVFIVVLVVVVLAVVVGVDMCGLPECKPSS